MGKITNPLAISFQQTHSQNDELTHKVATSKDVWMHARGFAGAHAIVCVRDAREPEEQDLQFAADLTAFFSKARNETRAPVIVADIQHIKRPKRAALGQVMVSKERAVLYGRPGSCAAAKEEGA